ncbi:MAG: hypothetical protein GXN91_02765 [Epsilonproteobacteria bacterium]|nr:hypothetical protein [Campylobacterota bacterium]
MRLFFILIFLASTFAAAQDTFKRYKFKSGMIYYDVKVSSFDNNLNSQVRGIARLIFDKWGLLELKEEDVAEIQAGDFNDTRSRHTMSKIEYGTVYNVDFDQKVIYKARDRDLDLAIMQKLDISDEAEKSLKEMGAKKVGKEKIAGYECDLWEYKDQQICLYGGIPLKIVVQNAGFYSEKKAVQVILDKPIPPKEFELPNFKIIEDEEYSSNRSSLVRTKDYIDSIKELKAEMKKRGINLEDKNLTITPELEKDIINILGKRYLKKQKKYLPKLLEELKKAKECIKKAKNEQEANECIKPVREINDILGDKTQKYDFKNLNEEKKKRAIEQIDNEIKHTQVTANCVAKYDKTTDVIICTEGTLNPE